MRSPWGLISMLSTAMLKNRSQVVVGSYCFSGRKTVISKSCLIHSSRDWKIHIHVVYLEIDWPRPPPRTVEFYKWTIATRFISKENVVVIWTTFKEGIEAIITMFEDWYQRKIWSPEGNVWLPVVTRIGKFEAKAVCRNSIEEKGQLLQLPPTHHCKHLISSYDKQKFAADQV